jgi:hypothetical protein
MTAMIDSESDECKLIDSETDSVTDSVTNRLLRLRPQYEYATPSHLIVVFNQTSLLDDLNNSSVNRTSRFIDHAQTLSKRAEK